MTHLLLGRLKLLVWVLLLLLLWVLTYIAKLEGLNRLRDEDSVWRHHVGIRPHIHLNAFIRSALEIAHELVVGLYAELMGVDLLLEGHGVVREWLLLLLLLGQLLDARVLDDVNRVDAAQHALAHSDGRRERLAVGVFEPLLLATCWDVSLDHNGRRIMLRQVVQSE
jgi:hypothetical protein